MNAYIAIGHFKDSENTTTVALMQRTKKAFMRDCYGNDFVPYVVLTEAMVEKVLSLGGMDLWDQVRKLTSNFRKWDEVADYIEQCGDIIEAEIARVKANAED